MFRCLGSKGVGGLGVWGFRLRVPYIGSRSMPQSVVGMV